MTYNLSWPSNLPLLRRLQTGADGVRALVYSGDTDPGVSSMISENITYSLDFPVREAWRPWTMANTSAVVLGQIVRWAGLDFVTIRGAGHMVPRFRPYAAYEMVQHWLWDEPYPTLAPAVSSATATTE
jgi:hypothetical protein